MGRKLRPTTAATDRRRLREGRGSGEGSRYRPWLTARDFISPGMVYRVPGRTSGRVHHIGDESHLEFFYVLEWSPHVTDIREHFPLLPLTDTVRLAKKLGVRHPVHAKSGEPRVLTSDFRTTLIRGGCRTQQVRAVLHGASQPRKGVLETLAIEREYWGARGENWGVVTRDRIPQTLVRNIRWVSPFAVPEACTPLTPRQIDSAAVLLISLLHDCARPLNVLALRCDTHLQLSPGSSLKIVRHLIASRRWNVDMNQEIGPTLPLHIQRVASDRLPSSRRIGE